jgi:glycosyltransferase involved in cell wall biosynthesis
MTGLSVFLPMHNERENINAAVETLLPVAEVLTRDYEVIIVDDGSTDGSSELAVDLAKRHPTVRVVTHPGNLGYGRALTTGYASARKERIFYTDSDLPIDYGEIPRAWDILQSGAADVVVGYRLNRERAFRRKVFTKVYNLLVRNLFALPVSDVNFSFKMITRDARDSLQLTARSGFIDGQLLHQLVRNGYRLREVGVEYSVRRKGESAFDSVGAALANLREMLAYWRTCRRNGTLHRRVPGPSLL